MTEAVEAGPGAVPGPAPAGVVQPLSRRDRMRAATMEEIKGTARRLLVEKGPDAVTLRAIAREMGMTAPGLYRYYGSREELIRNVVADIFTELAGDIHRAIDEAGGHLGQDEMPPDGMTPEQRKAKMTAKMVAACAEYRRWSLTHAGEFGLLFGVPLPGLDDGRYDIADECALQFAGTFFTLFLELWNGIHFPVPEPDEIDPGLRDQLGRFRDTLGADVPVGTMLTFLRCWMLLYGAVAMEVFGHLGFALEDPSPMFDITLSELARLVGLEGEVGPARPR